MSFTPRIRSALAALALAALAVVGPLPAPAAHAATCSGVWVVVESDVRCTSSYGTGLDALRGAGFSVETVGGGFVCRIDGSPSVCTMSSPYWTYFHSTRQQDGTWGPWVYSNLGAGSYHPAGNVAEGWAYGGGSTTPSTKPPTSTVTTSTTSTATTTTTTKATTTRPATTTTTRLGATSAPAVSGAPGSTAPSAPAATPTAAPGVPSPATATASAAPAPAPRQTAPSASEVGTPGAAIPATGTPTAALATGGLLALGGAGLGAWALRRRR